MTKTKSTKRALLTSALALIMCVSMLVGSTFAWFTDSVTSGSNVITAGNLDIEVQYTLDGENWDKLDGANDLFQKGLWEPGHTEVIALRIKNNGSLALKYIANMNIVNETVGKNKENKDIVLSDILTVSTLTQQANDANGIGDITLMLAYMGENRVAYENTTSFKDANILTNEKEMRPGDEYYLFIKVDMAETVGNEANAKDKDSVPSIEFGINFLATQYTSESDSFGNQYDKDATLPEVTVAYNADALAEALAAGGNVVLADDVVLGEKVTIPAGKEVTLDLGGHKLAGAFDNQGGSALIDNSGSLTVKNGTIVSLAEYPDVDWGTEGFPTYATNTISNKGVLVIENGAVIENQTAVGGASYAIDNYAGATLTVNGGTIKAQDVAIRMFSGSATAENKVVINGGTITGKRAVWVQLPSNNSAVAPKTTLEINGGELNSTSDLTIYSYSYGNSFAATNVTITGGTFSKDVAFGGGYKGDQENVSVTGGTFNGSLGRYLDNDGWVDIAKP